ncbi:hypothetical protein VFMJ11_B0022 (plasmid) [Aliivibrio fischeri MJ11]|uniref:Uncharacterized protein n=1 Tax=Aliivibrio fischeri (strain MJ11) TaxID=388396 RepID=B5EVW5_ALIFM|nr:hypothetical protein [Aliivibrio fischeri]ACH64751.1 hypothetical protein VFMJ11_B0022 [Aliivibrio fischeri MJ11]
MNYYTYQDEYDINSIIASYCQFNVKTPYISKALSLNKSKLLAFIVNDANLSQLRNIGDAFNIYVKKELRKDNYYCTFLSEINTYNIPIQVNLIPANAPLAIVYLYLNTYLTDITWSGDTLQEEGGTFTILKLKKYDIYLLHNEYLTVFIIPSKYSECLSKSSNIEPLIKLANVYDLKDNPTSDITIIWELFISELKRHSKAYLDPLPLEMKMLQWFYNNIEVDDQIYL